MAISTDQHRREKRAFTARIARRAPEVTTLVVTDLVFGVLCVVGIYAPATMHQFVTLGSTAAALLLTTAVALWLSAFRLGRFGLAIATTVDIGVTSALVSWARTPEGAVVICFGYVWAAIYAASALEFRPMLAVLIVISAGSAVGLATNGVGRWVGLWVVLTVTTWGAALVLERSVGRLRREAETDALTGLLNRRGFFKAAALERAVSTRVGLPLVLVTLDLDSFKEVNDSEGHAAGDRVLVEATAAWRAALREGDLLARFGGDEFVMLLADPEGDGARTALERCAAAHPIAWTAGVVNLHPDDDLDHCLSEADIELYQNKESKRVLAEAAARASRQYADQAHGGEVG